MPKRLSLIPKKPVENFDQLPHINVYANFIDKISDTADPKKSHQENSAFYSLNVGINALGLGFGYTAVHLATLWDFHEKYWPKDADFDAEDFAFVSLIPCMLLGVWHANITYRKNLLYEKNKARQKETIVDLKKQLNTLFEDLKSQEEALKEYIMKLLAKNENGGKPKIEEALVNYTNTDNKNKFSAETLLKFIEAVKKEDKNEAAEIIRLIAVLENIKLAESERELFYHFEEKYEALIEYNKMQAVLEALKKASRLIMLFTILFSLEFVGLGSFSEVMITALVTGGLAGFLGYRAQDKENDHDLKPRKLYEEQVALLEHQATAKLFQVKKKNITPIAWADHLDYHANIPEALKKVLDDKNPREQAKSPHPVYNLDNALTGLIITSGYIPLSVITLFAFKEHATDSFYNHLDMAEFVPVDALLFGIPSLIAVGIACLNIYRNIALYKLYEEEAKDLNKKYSELKNEIEKLCKQYHFEPNDTFNNKIAALLNTTLTTEQEHEEKEREYISGSYKKMEAIKKIVRVATLTFLFAGSTLTGSIGFMVCIAILAVVIGVLDHMWRQAKENIERSNSTLRKEVLKMENIKNVVIDNIAQKPQPTQTVAINNINNTHEVQLIPPPAEGDNLEQSSSHSPSNSYLPITFINMAAVTFIAEYMTSSMALLRNPAALLNRSVTSLSNTMNSWVLQLPHHAGFGVVDDFNPSNSSPTI